MKLAITLFTVLSLMGSASFADTLMRKYVTYCTISVFPTTSKLVKLADGMSTLNNSTVNWVYFHLADTPTEKYDHTLFGKSQYRIQFTLDGGSAKALYDICKEKLDSKETIDRMDVKKIDRVGEFTGLTFDDSSHQ